MALANSSWDSYPAGRQALTSARSRQSLLNALILGMLLLSGAGAALPILHMFNILDSAVTDHLPSDFGEPPRRPATVSPSLRDTKAEDFLRDSLLSPPIALDVAEAEKLGGFALSRGAPSGLQHFASRAITAPAEIEIAPLPLPAPTPAPVRIAPSLIMPVAPIARADVETPPVPAPRLDRSTTEIPSPAEAIAGPTEQASLPPMARLPAAAPIVGQNDGVAVYDISAATVYLPGGERLEAHSGLGYMVDDPRYADRKNIGPTPPNTYNLVRLPNLFFGVEALRLVPIDGRNKYGRDGFLTHTYLLRGRPAQSNGCVVFKDYARFLDAYKRGHIKRLVVVPSLSKPVVRLASASNG